MSETNDHLKKYLASIDRSWANGYRAAQHGSPRIKAEFFLAQVEDLFKRIDAIKVPHTQKMMESLPYGAVTDPYFMINHPVSFSRTDTTEKAPKLPTVEQETKDALRNILKTMAASPSPRGNPELFTHLDTLQALCKTIRAAYPDEHAHYGDDHPRNGTKTKQAQDIWDHLVNLRSAAVVLGLGVDAPIHSRQQTQGAHGLGS